MKDDFGLKQIVEDAINQINEAAFKPGGLTHIQKSITQRIMSVGIENIIKVIKDNALEITLLTTAAGGIPAIDNAELKVFASSQVVAQAFLLGVYVGKNLDGDIPDVFKQGLTE